MEKIKITWNRTASHEVDPQKGFTPICPNELPVPGGDEIVDELNRQATYAKYRTVSKDVHPANALWLANELRPQFTLLNLNNEPNVDVVWNAHCMSGTVGSELLTGLPKITEYDFVVFKGIEPNLHPYSGVYHDLEKTLTTGLIEFYESHRINTVIISGLALEYCVRETVNDLMSMGFLVIVNLPGTRSLGPADKAIKELKDSGIICIESLDELELINTNL